MKRARWWAVVLGVSVALNLFFLGLLSARAFQRTEVAPERHGPVNGAQHRPWKRPRPFEWMSEEERAELRPRRKDLRSARRAAEDALRAEPFDLERLRSSLADVRRGTDQIQASVHDRMLERASRMTAEERRHLADVQWGPDERR